jgi:L-fucose mutarotase
MLKGIPPVISPELIKILMEMGHGDELVISDGNFPATSVAQRLVRSDGLGVPLLLDAVLQLFPLDQFVEKPVALMAVVQGEKYNPIIWDEFRLIVKKYEHSFSEFEFVERFDFYERSKKAYAVIASSEMSLYANIILKKGVIKV